MSAHSEAVAHLTGLHHVHPSAFGTLESHSTEWLEMLDRGLHQAGDQHEAGETE